MSTTRCWRLVYRQQAFLHLPGRGYHNCANKNSTLHQQCPTSRNKCFPLCTEIVKPEEMPHTMHPVLSAAVPRPRWRLGQEWMQCQWGSVCPLCTSAGQGRGSVKNTIAVEGVKWRMTPPTGVPGMPRLAGGTAALCRRIGGGTRCRHTRWAGSPRPACRGLPAAGGTRGGPSAWRRRSNRPQTEVSAPPKCRAVGFKVTFNPLGVSPQLWAIGCLTSAIQCY